MAYEDKTVDELKEEARTRDLSGFSQLNKSDLVKLLEENDANAGEPDAQYGQSPEELEAQAEGDENQPVPEQEAALAHHSAASDPENPEVQENLSPEGQEALQEYGEDSVAAEEADLALDASGPLHFESPSERVMTGAVNEDHAKEQEELLRDLPEDYLGEVSEAGDPLRVPEDEPKQQEDVIDFPPPRSPEDDARRAVVQDRRHGRTYAQKAVLYTDGISGAADGNLERAYHVPETLKSAAATEAYRKAAEQSTSHEGEDNEEGND